MNRHLSITFLMLLVMLAALLAAAKEPKETGYQTAMVVGVESVAPASNYVGDSPTDAPLMPESYSYNVTFRLNCNVYVGRYESATDYLPAAFAANHQIDVRLTGHVIYVSLPSHDRAIKMGVVSHKRLKEQSCPATS